MNEKRKQLTQTNPLTYEEAVSIFLKVKPEPKKAKTKNENSLRSNAI